MPAIFMIGTQRSGSNMFRLMLNQLGDVAAPHPPHVMERFTPLLPLYGDLNDQANFALLVEDVCRLVELNPVPWEGVDLEDRGEVIARCKENSLVAIYGAVYDIMAEANGAKHWLCKSLANVRFLPELERYFPDAKFLHLYRDGRDVAVSFRKVIVGEKTFYNVAKAWEKDQQLALGLRQRIDESRLFSVSYEQLTDKTEIMLQRLCEFLDVEYTDAMMHFNESAEATRTARSGGSMWGNVRRPVMRNNTRKFFREAKREDYRIFELVSGELLDLLGYELVFSKRGEKRRRKGEELAFAEIQRHEAENKRLKDEFRRKLAPEELKLRAPQEALFKEIKARAPKPAAGLGMTPEQRLREVEEVVRQNFNQSQEVTLSLSARDYHLAHIKALEDGTTHEVCLAKALHQFLSGRLTEKGQPSAPPAEVAPLLKVVTS